MLNGKSYIYLANKNVQTKMSVRYRQRQKMTTNHTNNETFGDIFSKDLCPQSVSVTQELSD